MSGDVRPQAGMKSASQTGRDDRGPTASELRDRVLRRPVDGSFREWSERMRSFSARGQSQAQLAAPCTGDGASKRTVTAHPRAGP